MSRSINGVIRPVLKGFFFFFFFFDKISQVKKKHNQYIVLFQDKISQVQKSTKKHNQYIVFVFFFRIRFHKYKKAPKTQSIYCFFQDKILSTLNTLVFVQDKILYQMWPSSQFSVIYIHVFLP